MSPAASRIRFAAYLLVACAVVLEATLQVGALMVWLWSSPQPDAARELSVDPEATTVLCVGDSWTQGMGSTDPAERSYPAVAERVLLELDPSRRWRVVNAGLAGRNSREALENLPSQLARYRPDLVLVLVGSNDYWSVPELLELDGEGSDATYRFRWRTGRLLAWLVGKLAAEGAPPGLPATGEWAPREVAPLTPYPTPDESWAENPDSIAAKRRGRAAMGRGQLGTAVAEFETALQLEPADPLVRQDLVRAHTRLGNQDRVEVQLRWLRARWEDRREYWVGDALVRSLGLASRWTDVIGSAQQVVARYPESPEIWRLLAEAHHNTGNSLQASLDAATSLSKQESAAVRLLLCRALLRLDKRDEAVRCLITAYLLFNDAEWLAEKLRAPFLLQQAERFARLVEEIDCTPEQRHRLRRIQEFTKSQKDRVGAVLARHLAQIVERSRAAGATPVFLTYPIEMRASREATARRAARELAVPLLDVVGHFEPLVAERGWAALSSGDGHCNDEGYEIMARFVAAGVAELAPPR